MSIDLTKTPQPLNDPQGVPLTQFSFGVGWDVSGQGKKGLLGRINRARGVDLDASVVAIDGDGNAIGNCHFDNLRPFGGALTHTGDNRTGKGDGIDEQVDVNLPGLPNQVVKLVCVLSSYKGATFEKVNNAECKVMQGDVEVAHLYLPIDASNTAVVMAKVERTPQGTWTMASVLSFGHARTTQDVMNLAKSA